MVELSKKVKSSQGKSRWTPSVISAHSLPPLLASGAHSIGYVCLSSKDLTCLDLPKKVLALLAV